MCCHLANDNDLLTPVVWATAGDNKQLDLRPADSFTELIQNWIRSSHGHSTPSLKISCKSVQPFSRNVADKETNKEANKQTKKSSENKTPSSYRGRGNKSNTIEQGKPMNSQVIHEISPTDVYSRSNQYIQHALTTFDFCWQAMDGKRCNIETMAPAWTINGSTAEVWLSGRTRPGFWLPTIDVSTFNDTSSTVNCWLL